MWNTPIFDNRSSRRAAASCFVIAKMGALDMHVLQVQVRLRGSVLPESRIALPVNKHAPFVAARGE
jgi:hypothetical protein